MTFPVGWLRYAPIVIQAVEDTLVNFPVHLDRDCFPTEALDSASGNKALSDGADLRFSSDLAGTTELPFEVVRWTQDATLGNRRATVHVKVPGLSITATTTIYVWYKNSGATMPAAGAANGSQAVWDSSFKGVYHLGSTSTALDSTSNATSGTWEGSPAATADSPVGTGVDFDAVDDAVSFGTTNYNDNLYELVLKLDATSDQIVFGKTSSTASDASMSVWVSSTKPTGFADTDGAIPYGYTFADTSAGSTANWEYWAIRNRSTAGGAVVSKALPTQEQTHQAWASDGTYMYSIGGHQLTIGSPVAYNQRYNPAGDSWTTLTVIPAARWGMGSCYLGGKIYCFGGTTDGATASSRLDIYDIAGNSWSAGTALPASLTTGVYQGQRACTDGTYIYVFSNQNLERYDPGGNSWSAMTTNSLNTGTWQSLICTGGYIYVIGGFNLNTTIPRYSIAGNSWTAGYDVAPYAAWAHLCEPKGDGTWMVGFGRQSGSEQFSVLYNYDPVNKVWTKLRSFDLPTNAVAAGVFSSKLYVYGAWVIGKTETYSFGHHACYNISSGDWETVPAVIEFVRDTNWIAGKVVGTALYAGTGKLYIGRQDGYGSLFSGAKVAHFRRSNSARSKAWMKSTRTTLMSASTFSTIGSPVDNLAVNSGRMLMMGIG